MTSPAQTLRTIADLCATQRLAVLATDMGGHPYANLVAFAATDDLREVLFATIRTTRKFSNLEGNHRVSLLVDDRSNSADDFRDAAAVTIMGTARELAGEERAARLPLYLSRHPYLDDFVASPTCALIAVAVERCVLVTRFQTVTEVVPAP